MTITEFMTFVSLVCNFDAHSSVLSRDYKEQCAEFYVNCAIRDDQKIERGRLSGCVQKAKQESVKWK